MRGIFGLGRDDDSERKLRNISKEESPLLARIQGRSNSASCAVRLLFFSSSSLKVAAISYAISKLRSSNSDWADRVLSVLKVLVLPGLAVLCYWTIQRLARILDSKDQKKLERLQSQRQAKIDELKQRTNFYDAQQLIQRDDPAASIFGSKSVANSDSQASATCETPLVRKSNTLSPEVLPDCRKGLAKDPKVGTVNYDSTAVIEDCGWIVRITSLLVDEDTLILVP